MNRLPLSLLCLLVIGCQPAEAGNDPDAIVADVAFHEPFDLTPIQARGRVLYETMCWTCHGLAGRGDGPAVEAGAVGLAPPTFHTADYAESDAGRLEGRFRVGINGTDPEHPHMQYVASLLKPEKFAEALSFIPVLAYPPEIPGSAFAGQALYEYRCIGCHGVSGRGDGTAAASLRITPPADFTQDTLIASRDWDGLYKRVQEGGHEVHGSSMPPWGMVLTGAEIWDLVAYIATFQPGLLSTPAWMR
jgi:mono/diheme cytochrome c family protein